MAVEKSYARLGFFLVVALVVVLATALLFIQRMRSRAVIELVTYTTENVSGLDISSPVRYRGVSVGRVTDIRVDPRANRRDQLRDVPRPPQHHWIRCRADPAIAAIGVFAKASRPGGGQPRDRRGVPAARSCRRTPRHRSRWGSHRIGRNSVDAHTVGDVQDRLPEVLERAEATLRTLTEIVARIPAASIGATDSSPTSSASFRRATCRR